MTYFPKTIHFLSDDTEATYKGDVGFNPKPGERFGLFVFTKSSTNLGVEFPMDIKNIERLLSEKLIVCQ